MADFRYKAFISYSWANAEWGNWLHRSIETFRVPAGLVGEDGEFGPVPPRLQPLFKDREEEAAGASIGDAVSRALASSEFLIVICSPESAQSQWVNHEIAWFKAHRNPSKILSLIVDGEPGVEGMECFPKALTHKVASDLSITDQPVDAPLAADARVSGDGKRGALLKLAAAMLGVGLDELVRRDERRRIMRTRMVVGASLALAIVMSGLALVAVQARNEADHQRAEADGLVEFMLTDLRDKLEPVGRLDALDVVGQRALTYYASQKPSDLDADSLGRRSRALHLVGEIRNIRGDSAAGLKAFSQAAATTEELLARDPDNAQRVFDHAQSEFWVGYIAYERGETKEAENRFTEYKRLADRLVTLEPGKLEWQLELFYAETNLGVMLFTEGRFADAEPAFAKGLEMIQSIAAKEKYDASRQLELGVAQNWLGSVRSKLGNYRGSRLLHQREIGVYSQLLKKEPANTAAKYRLAVAWQHMGALELTTGHIEDAIEAIDISMALMKELRSIEPADTEWQETEFRALQAQVDNLFYAGSLAKSAAMQDRAAAALNRMTSADPSNRIWSVVFRSILHTKEARRALVVGDPDSALQEAKAVIRKVEQAKDYNSAGLKDQAAHAYLLAGDALLALGREDEARAHWRKGLAIVSAEAANRPGYARRDQFILLKRLGRNKDAQQQAVALDRQGVRHPAYIREKLR
ncbi:MAG: toll/interleukin-1 receptor domain-containing protein [Erythrobacter sp.]|nr:toll/interleukin-1 receptor domain-containing protein [Erythrobacter sp.]